MTRFFTLFFLTSVSLFAAERTLIIENPAERGIYVARSLEIDNEIITEGFWNVLPHQKESYEIPQAGKLTVRINFYEVTENATPAGLKRCGSKTERFKSIEKKQGQPQFTLFTGEGEVDGYALKKEGKDCSQAGGELLDGFADTVVCSTTNSTELCLSQPIRDIRPDPEAYVGVCNDTDIANLYVAIRFYQSNEFRTQGWWKVASHKCLKLGPFPSEKGIYGFATTDSLDPDASEWRPTWDNALACMNPETAFDYAETPNGLCEARESIPADAPSPIKIPVGKLASDGFRGLVTFDLKPSFISLFRSPSTGDFGLAKDPSASAAKLAAKAICKKQDCEEVTQVQNQCLAFAVGSDVTTEFGWGRNADRKKAEELALNYCRESSEEPSLCRVLISECP